MRHLTAGSQRDRNVHDYLNCTSVSIVSDVYAWFRIFYINFVLCHLIDFPYRARLRNKFIFENEVKLALYHNLKIWNTSAILYFSRFNTLLITFLFRRRGWRLSAICLSERRMQMRILAYLITY